MTSIAVGLAAFMLGYLLGAKERIITFQSSVVPKYAKVAIPAESIVDRSTQTQRRFRVPRSRREYQAQWEAAHNQKAQTRQRVGEQFIQAQKGELE